MKKIKDEKEKASKSVSYLTHQSYKKTQTICWERKMVTEKGERGAGIDNTFSPSKHSFRL